jgi:hypothetical protein
LVAGWAKRLSLSLRPNPTAFDTMFASCLVVFIGSFSLALTMAFDILAV